MDHVIASAPEDSAEAVRLAEMLRISGLQGRFECLEVGDETEMGELLEDDRDGASTYVLLLSRAFAARIRSLAALDALLGELLLGRRRILAASLPEERQLPREVQEVVLRHDGIGGVPTLDELARRMAGRLGRIHVLAQAGAGGRRSSSSSQALRNWLIGTIVALLALLFALWWRTVRKS